MFSRIATIFTVLFFAVFVTASAVARADCSTGSIQCCNSLVGISDPLANALAGLLGIVLGPGDALVGITCNPISVIGIGGPSCSVQTACCANNNFAGIIALGCIPININL